MGSLLKGKKMNEALKEYALGIKSAFEIATKYNVSISELHTEYAKLVASERA